jgi:hypothetical protein
VRCAMRQSPSQIIPGWGFGFSLARAELGSG